MTSPVVFSSRVRCPGCRRHAFPLETGRCECGYRLIAPLAKPPQRRRRHPDPAKRRQSRGPRAHRGVPILMDTSVIDDAYRLYRDHGLGLRRVAHELHQSTGYANEHSFAVSLAEQWRIRGWPLRDRITAVVTASTVHGRARDREHRRELRRRRGEIRGVQCAGVKLTHPEKGRRCRRAALAGEEFCAQHSPERRQDLLDQLAAARQRRSSERRQDRREAIRRTGA